MTTDHADEDFLTRAVRLDRERLARLGHGERADGPSGDQAEGAETLDHADEDFLTRAVRLDRERLARLSRVAVTT